LYIFLSVVENIANAACFEI